MKLMSIRIRRMPGIDDPLPIEDVAPGMNVVEGPNGAGKTSVCRAIAATLWSDKSKDLELDALWQDDGLLRTVERRGAKCNWQAGGIPSIPHLPPAHLSPCFTIRVDEILHVGANDADLAGLVASEMSGGYDLGKVRSARTWIPTPKATRTGWRKELQQAAAEAQKCEAAQLELARREAELPALQALLRESEEAGRETNRLRTALDLANTRLALDQIRIQKELFEPAMARLDGTDLKAMNALKAAIDAAEASIRANREMQRDANDRIAECRFPENRPIPPSELQAWSQRVIKWADLPSRIQQSQLGARKAEATLGITLKSLGGHTGLDKAPVITPESVKSAADCIRRSAELHSKKAAIDERLRLLGVSGGSGDTATLEAAMRALIGWMSQPDAVLSASNVARTWILVLFALVAAVGITGAILISPASWLAALFGGAGLAVTFSLLKPAQSVTADTRMFQRAEFEKQGVAAPTEWSRSFVEQRVRELQEQIARAEVAKEKASHREQVELELEKVREEIAQLKSEIETIENETGFDLTGINLDSARMLDALCAYQQAVSAWKSASAETDLLQNQLDERLTELNEFLRPYALPGENLATDAESARARLDALAERNRNLTGSMNQLATALRVQQEAERLCELKTEELKHFLQHRDCEDERTFHRRFDRLPEWNTLSQEETTQLSLAARYEHVLDDRPDLASLDASAVHEHLQAQEALSGRLLDLQQKITRVETEVDRAKRESNLEEARQKEEGRRDEIRTRFETELLKLAVQQMLDAVEVAHTRLQPGVLSTASEVFSRFTRGRFRLQVDTSGREAGFVAIDTRTEKGYRLSELSGGTRVQLLMASRMAFADSVTSGRPLPLFLDETLKHSDPDRFDAIAQVLCELIKDGRQVFYLTNDPNETRRLEEIFHREGQSIHRIDLSTVRSSTLAVPDVAIVQNAILPDLFEATRETEVVADIG